MFTTITQVYSLKFVYMKINKVLVCRTLSIIFVLFNTFYEVLA